MVRWVGVLFGFDEVKGLDRLMAESERVFIIYCIPTEGGYAGAGSKFSYQASLGESENKNNLQF